MNCPICSAEISGQPELCPQCGFNLRLGPPAELEPKSQTESPSPEPELMPEPADAAEPVPVIAEPRPPAGSGVAVTRCERCGETRVDAIFRCGDRASSQCPYVEEQRPRRLPARGLIFISAAAAVGLGVLGLAVTKSILAALLAAAVALIIGGYLVYSVRIEQLVHRSTAAQLGRISLWGREFQRHFTTAPEPVKLDLPPVSSLRYPPSIAFLGTRDAVGVVRAALIGLIAGGRIQPLQYRVYRLGSDGISRSWQDFCRLDRDGPEGEASARSWLEGALLRASTERPTLDRVVHDIFDKDKSSPESWLLSQIQKSAASRGWGELTGGLLRRQFQPAPEHVESMAQDREVIERLSRELEAANPSFSRALDDGIRRGIGSRREKGC